MRSRRILSADERLRRMNEWKWVSTDGTEIRVRDMAADHVINAVRKYRRAMAKVLIEIVKKNAPRGQRRKPVFVDAATVDLTLTVVVPPFAALLREVRKRKLTV